MRRGAFKKGGTKIPVDSIEHFHHIIRPGDSVETTAQEFDFNTPISHVNPILLAKPQQLLSKEESRLRLGIPNNALAVYIQLGAGKINDIEGQLEMAIRILNENQSIHIVVGESIIGDRLRLEGDRIRIIRDYPNSLSFNGFDFAIMAGGYNSYHEAIAFQLPTIFVPNDGTGMDDQIARVKSGQNAGACLVVNGRDQDEFRVAIEHMIDDDNRKKIIAACSAIRMENGADHTANHLIQLML